MPLASGTRLGTYEIVGSLGAGGMGEVYRARDTRLGREVALKVLPADVAADADRLERFELEAKAVASLNHPNIVTLFSVEDHGGTRVITMELVDGESLARQVAPGGLPIARLVELGIALADALSAAHEKGVVHRDLKPANVMLTRDGRVKVLDFGLAKLHAPGASVDASQAPTVASQLTTPGQIVGTVPYMAPEQVRGEAVDTRTDLFALGTMLYELCAGRRPFDGATVGTISSAILRDTPPSLATLRGDVPSDLERIIARCLEKEPRARFQTALDVANELRRMRPGRDAAAIAKPPPAPSTMLLGREEHLELAVRRLREGARVLTISGYGGTGKTRFAIELFHRSAPGFAGGAAFVSLASVTTAADVLSTIVTELGIGEAHGRSALEALAAVIGGHPVLLVLDNLEQVLDAAPDIAALVARCPALQIVATSRAPLKIGAESEFALPPLELPRPEETSLDVLGHCASVALFVQRAEKVKPGFALTSANASAIGAICRRLDGLPLALELAAARVRILEPTGLLQRLDHALDLLTSGDRDLPLRQRTLRTTISWSYSLLAAEEQRLLRRVSVFHEGWTLEAMEEVVYDATERARALDELDSLVEKGLVRVVGEGARYALLETIRAFAAEQLHASGEAEAVQGAHADHFVRFSAEVANGVFAGPQLEAVIRGRHENANTQAAIRWLTSRARQGDLEALEKGLLLCGQLDWFWHMGGQHLTARTLLDGLLPIAVDRPPSRGRGLARLAAGMVTTCTGEWDRSEREWAGGHADGVAIGDESIAAEGAMGVGYCHLHAGRLDQANAAFEEAIARSANGVSDFMHGISMTFQSMLLFSTGKLDAGIARVEEARRIQERLHDDEGGGVAASFLAQMVFAKGDHARAIQLYREALVRLERVGDQPEVARVHGEMGWTALAAGDARAARHSFVQGVRVNELVGSAPGTGLALLGLAAVEAALGHSERAVSIAAAARALSERAGVVVRHPMDPGVVERIDALKASIPQGALDSLVANASTLSPGAIVAMLDE